MRQPHVAYLCSQYPAVSHTFINREIEQLEANGVKVSPFSMRPGSILAGATDFEVSQMKDTWVIHKQSLFTILMLRTARAPHALGGFAPRRASDSDRRAT